MGRKRGTPDEIRRAPGIQTLMQLFAAGFAVTFAALGAFAFAAFGTRLCRLGLG
jgi:hypothetical protein